MACRKALGMVPEPILIVLVEDDDGHATLVERNLAASASPTRSCA